MKNGSLIMTNHWGEANTTMMGIVIKTRRRGGRITCDVLWSNGDMQEFINPKWLIPIDNND